MTEPLFRDFTHVPEAYLGLVKFFLQDFRDVYHLPTGAHDLHLLETGRLTDDEFFDRLCARWASESDERVDPREAQRYVWGKSMVACGAMEDAVRQLRGAGIRTALLTNISRDGEAIWRSLVPTDELFDTVIDSSKVGLRKPDPQIYLLTCERLGLQPQECLFVDDLRCNIEAATALGMDTIHCHDPVDIADEVVRRFLGHSAAAEATSG